MEIQVKKWGNSLGLILPHSIANEANIIEGTKVDIVFKHNKIEINTVSNNKYTLEELLVKVSNENIHDEYNTGESFGNEIW